MRIRLLLHISVAAALLLVLALGLSNWLLVQRMEVLSANLAQAQVSIRNISRLLILAQEYARYGEERVVLQWKEKLAALSGQPQGDVKAGAVPPQQFPEQIAVLSHIFEQLEAASQSPETPFQMRRKRLLMDQMLIQVSTMSNSVESHEQAVRTEHESVARQLRWFGQAITLAMLVLIAGLGLLLQRRVLQPLARLQTSVRAVAKGDLTVRSASTANDELGELSRTFDAMAVDLVEELRKEVAERKAAEAEQGRLLAQVERDRMALVSTLENLRRSEEAMRESDGRLRDAQRMAQIGNWELFIQTNHLVWSDELYRICEIDPAQFGASYEAFLDAIHPDDREFVDKNYTASVKNRTSYSVDHRLLMKSGKVKFVQERGETFYDAQGIPVRSVGTIQDITERKQAEETLRESEATVCKKLKAIVEPEGDISTLELSDIMDVDIMQSMMEEFGRATGMLGAVLDLSGKVLVAFGWQDICTKFHRCHPDTLKNCVESDTALTRGVPPGTVKAYRCKNNMWDMVTPLMVGDRHIGNVFFGQFFYAGETPDVELFRAQARQHGFDETEYLAALAQVPHFNREAAEAGLLFCARLAGIVTTLSYNGIKQARMLAERERLRNELITLNTELDLKVDQRTAQLEATNKELEAFSYSVSHDLRAPLRHISGYVELLNNRFREALPEKAGHYLNQVTDSASQMGALIDDLLQFSRTGRQELRQAEMDMNTVVQEALEKLKPETKNRNIFWTVAELPRVYGDYSLLQQVWINLLDNAVKYTRDKDQATIEVGFTRVPDQWEFFVRDNGVGFDMQYAHKLFGVFQRLHSPAQFEGTGIGLANVQRIVHKHGGRVRAEAQPDKGATFYFTLPRKSFAKGGPS